MSGFFLNLRSVCLTTEKEIAVCYAVSMLGSRQNWWQYCLTNLSLVVQMRVGRMESVPTVFVVDDDESVRNCVRRLVESVQLHVETFNSADEFLKVYEPARPGCLVLDVRMPGMSGLELQARLVELKYSLPVILLSGYGDVSVAVRAMKAGAVSYLEKPVNDHLLFDTIREAIARDAQNRRDLAMAAEIQARIDRLTPREHEVMDLLADGNVSKEVAAKLRLSPKTVEVHRAHVMKKMKAKTIADLVRFALLARTSKGNS